MLGQLGAGEHVAGLLHEQLQQFELVAGEVDGHLVHPGAGLARIQADGPAVPQGAAVRRKPPQQGAQAGQQLFHVKGFGQVIIGPGIHAGDFFVPAAARRQNQHRHAAPLAAPAAQYAQAIDDGQAQVQHDRIKIFHLAQVSRFLAIAGHFHGMTSSGNGGDQLGEQGGLVFYDQNAHGDASLSVDCVV